MPVIEVHRLGLTDYSQAWTYQHSLFRASIDRKMANRELPAADQVPPVHHLVVCEHPPVITLGKSGKQQHLIADAARLQQLEVAFVKTNRGGDITFHGHGQLVVYPILDLHDFFTDIGRYMRCLEEVVIRTLADYGLQGDRLPGATGVWLDPQDDSRARKICAMGVRSSRWVTMHGLALNVSTDLRYFELIVPCGIADKAVTSLQQERGEAVSLPAVTDKLLQHFAAVFGADLMEFTS